MTHTHWLVFDNNLLQYRNGSSINYVFAADKGRSGSHDVDHQGLPPLKLPDVGIQPLLLTELHLLELCTNILIFLPKRRLVVAYENPSALLAARLFMYLNMRVEHWEGIQRWPPRAIEERYPTQDFNLAEPDSWLVHYVSASQVKNYNDALGTLSAHREDSGRFIQTLTPNYEGMVEVNRPQRDFDPSTLLALDTPLL